MKHPRVIRHNRSGVWICYVLGPGEIPGSIKLEGRRMWAWSGGRLETSQIATKGASSSDDLGDWVENEILANEHLCDCITTTPEIVEACRELPRSSGRRKK